MPGKKKLQLALIIIVDGVLIAHQQMSHPTMKYVRMVQDVDTFCSHRWGRESFIKTTTCMKPPKFVRLKCEDPIGAMLQLLKQETLRLRGFPLALQLLAYQAVPKLQSTIPIPFDSPQVTSLIPIHSQPQPGWGVWPDVSNDDRVSYMEQLIADHRPFTKDLWHVGVTSEPLITTLTNDEDQPKAKKTKPEAPPKNAYKSKPVTKKVLKARKTSKKKDTVLSRLQKESKLLRKLLKRKKTTTSFKRSAFNTLLGEGLVKKGNTAFEHKGCQTEPTNVNVPVSIHDVPLTVRLIYIIFGFSSTCLSRRLLWRKITATHRSSANTRHSFTAQLLTAIPQLVNPSTLPPFTLHPSIPHPSTIPKHLHPPSMFHPAHPNSPEAITPHPPSLSQPKYDTSCNQSLQRRIFPLLPLHLTPELDSLPGFVGHATAINAFSATATSKPSSVPNTKPSSALQAQPTEDSDIVSLSDGSPAPETPKHIPSMEENHLAKQLLRCKTVPAPDLLSPIPQIEWDLFEKIISNFSAAFHITPSKLDFSNNFLLQLAQPMKGTTTYHMEILMHMLAARHRGVFEEQKLAFITPHLTS
ncbi:hypothetical protein F2Q69_00035824 [Brassica cretica]|uniref:DUF1985 domain-containing protein n=1 Tax=Brassica cretica TaxID=69181 RepID=A0A8S9SLQ6_BRACR|nr:hypothetical protein F2Q69_00035824 [Brassica cretica]